MGIPGLLKETGKGDRVALSKLAVEFLERHQRPIRIAIDIAIWHFQNQAGQGGANPALRTLYYRLVRLLALPIHPLFVYDGRNKPLSKRNRVVSRYGASNVHDESSKKLLRLFRMPYRIAPGEAEAECALLQRENIVDAVMSEDVDVLMWGSTVTLRDWSSEGTRGNKAPTHVNILRAEDLWKKVGLDAHGMILVAMLSGGDYAPEGIPGFGPGLACEVAKAKFGTELLDVVSKGDVKGLVEWRERLRYELESNESGYFRTKHKSVRLPDDFPDDIILRCYTHPAVSTSDQLRELRGDLPKLWEGELDVSKLREYVAETFGWQYRGGACKLIRSLSPALLARRLLQQKGTDIRSSDAIVDRRMHFVTDGIPELRIAATPADIVGLKIEAEEEGPDSNTALADAATADEDPDAIFDFTIEPENEPYGAPSKKSRPRKASPWDAHKPEKMWIPETIVKLGIPDLVEEWEQKQRDIMSDPKRFIASKARKTHSSTSATQASRTINSYFSMSKAVKPGDRVRVPVPAPIPLTSRDKMSGGPHSFHGTSTSRTLNARAPSTPPRRKARSNMTSPTAPVAANVNPFSLATGQSSVRACNALIKPIRRKARPMQKSRTMPCTVQEEEEASIISITSSPLVSVSPLDSRRVLETSEAATAVAAVAETGELPYPDPDPYRAPAPPSSSPASKIHRRPRQKLTKSLSNSGSGSSHLTVSIDHRSRLDTNSSQEPEPRPKSNHGATALSHIFRPRSPPHLDNDLVPTNITRTAITETKTTNTPSSPVFTNARTHVTSTSNSNPTISPDLAPASAPKQNPNPYSKTKTTTKIVLPRSSLPGTWKEVDVLPDKDRKIDYGPDADTDASLDVFLSRNIRLSKGGSVGKGLDEMRKEKEKEQGRVVSVVDLMDF